jgi:hypothetical protein
VAMRWRWKFADRKDLFSLRLRRETVKSTDAQAYTCLDAGVAMRVMQGGRFFCFPKAPCHEATSLLV